MPCSSLGYRPEMLPAPLPELIRQQEALGSYGAGEHTLYALNYFLDLSQQHVSTQKYDLPPLQTITYAIYQI